MKIDTTHSFSPCEPNALASGVQQVLQRHLLRSDASANGSQAFTRLTRQAEQPGKRPECDLCLRPSRAWWRKNC